MLSCRLARFKVTKGGEGLTGSKESGRFCASESTGRERGKGKQNFGFDREGKLSEREKGVGGKGTRKKIACDEAGFRGGVEGRNGPVVGGSVRSGGGGVL